MDRAGLADGGALAARILIADPWLDPQAFFARQLWLMGPYNARYRGAPIRQNGGGERVRPTALTVVGDTCGEKVI